MIKAQKNNKSSPMPEGRKCAAHGKGKGALKQPEPGIKEKPDANVDQDDHCIMPAYGETAGPNTGEPCDDGRGAGQ